MSGLRLQLLGAPHFEKDGTAIEIGRRKAVALLAYLAITNQPHRREALAAMLWPDYDESSAFAYLRRSLWLLKKTLGDNWFITDQDSIGLLFQPDLWVDVDQFQKLLARAQADRHPPGELCDNCLSTLAEATALYRGDFLSGFTLPDAPNFDEWQFFQTETLRQQIASALDQLVDTYRRQGRFDAAIDYARHRLNLDPLHEPAHQQLMQLYAWSNQQAAALRQYQECERLLEKELGISPSDETNALHKAIKSKQLPPARPVLEQASLNATPVVLPGNYPLTPQPVNNEPPFVARTQELTRLRAHLDAVLNGEGQVVFITGEAGQGKTALLREFTQRAEAAQPNLIVAGGNCNAYSGIGDPYHPFREILETISGDFGYGQSCCLITSTQAQRLQANFPHAVQALLENGPDLIDTCISGPVLMKRVNALLPGSEQADALAKLLERKQRRPVNREQSYIFDQYTRVLDRLAAASPLLIILDDLQWADAASISLLFHLGRHVTGRQIMIVGAYRPEEMALGRNGERHPLEKVIAEFKRIFGDIQIDLGGVETVEGRAFVEAYLDTQPNRLDENFRRGLLDHTDGHALFVIELLREMQDRGDLVRDEDGRWVEGSQLDFHRLPARVEGVIEERIGRLSPELRQILAVASVEGDHFTAEVIAHVQQCEQRHLLHTLAAELDKRHQLVKERESPTKAQQHLTHYRFTHFLFEHYMYRSLSNGERRLLHRDVAQALETLYQENLDRVTVQLARHYLEAGNRHKAAAYLLAAGDQARRSVALDEAVQHYQTAIDLWPESDTAGRAELLKKLGECLWIMGNLEDARQNFELSYLLYQSLGNRIGAGAAQRLIGRICWEQADRKTSLNHFQQALSLLEGEAESVELAWAISSLSQMRMLASEYDQSIAQAEEAIQLAQNLGAEDVCVNASINIGTALLMLGQWERGRRMLLENKERAIALGLPQEAGRAYYNLGYACQYSGYHLEAQKIYAELELFATRTHTWLHYIGALIGLMEIDWVTGQWATAFERRQMMIDQHRPLLYLGRGVLFASRIFGLMHNDLGQPQIALEHLERGLPAARNYDELQAVIPHLGQLIRTYSLLDLNDQTGVIIEEMFDYLDRATYLEVGSLMSLLHVCRWSAGHPNRLHQARRALQYLIRADAQLNCILPHAALTEAKGWVALAEGKLNEAIEQFRQAAEEWAQLNRPIDRLQSLNGLAQALTQADDCAGAETIAEQACQIIDMLAGQLDGPDQKQAFLASSLVQQFKTHPAIDCIE